MRKKTQSFARSRPFSVGVFCPKAVDTGSIVKGWIGPKLKPDYITQWAMQPIQSRVIPGTPKDMGPS